MSLITRFYISMTLGDHLWPASLTDFLLQCTSCITLTNQSAQWIASLYSHDQQVRENTSAQIMYLFLLSASPCMVSPGDKHNKNFFFPLVFNQFWQRLSKRFSPKVVSSIPIYNTCRPRPLAITVKYTVLASMHHNPKLWRLLWVLFTSFFSLSYWCWKA